jgi:hypothetical protein
MSVTLLVVGHYAGGGFGVIAADGRGCGGEGTAPDDSGESRAREECFAMIGLHGI